MTLNKETPDDVAVYGHMADAEIALGDFQGAVENTRWMLNLRPGNTPGLIRAGRLRELYRDWSGAGVADGRLPSAKSRLGFWRRWRESSQMSAGNGR
jgi:hypothetical protein